MVLSLLCLLIFCSVSPGMLRAQEVSAASNTSQFELTAREEQQLAALRPLASRWEKEIAALEELDKSEQAHSQTVLFVGSSSIRLWKSMPQDMSPWPTMGRGYGGAKLSDLVIFVDRLIQKHPYRALVVFAANDISGSPEDKTPQQVLQLCQLLVKIVRQSHPDQPIFFIAITPTPKRFHVWDKISEANRLLRDFTKTDTNLYYIDTVSEYLDERGQPRAELFTEDKLHQNPAGYRRWSAIIKRELSAKLGDP